MLLSLFLTCFAALVITTALLLAVGHRIRFSARILGILLSALVAVAGGKLVTAIWHTPRGYVEEAGVAIVVLTIVVAWARPVWNPVGQAFFGSLMPL